ncbi:MAG: hypothetical protein ACK41E_11905, partial [Deinococcales bacterium]
ASEGLYALCLDLQLEPKTALRILEQLEIFPEALRQTIRLFTENETLEVLTRERILARRAATRPSALELARTGNKEGLRRVSGRDLQLAQQAANPSEATLLIEAWNLLSLYEQQRV